MEDEDYIIVDKNKLDELIQRVRVLEKKIDNLDASSWQKLLYTNDELQELLDVTARTLQSYRNKGEIGFIKKGRKIYYRKEHVQEFLGNGEKSSF
jgi:SPX domain protein involved in polyphosphate accumulation